MPASIHMRGLLEPILIDEGFLDAVSAMNMSKAQGKQFIIGNTLDGGSVAMFIDNVLTITEVDDDGELVIA